MKSFAGKIGRQVHNYALLGIFIGVHTFFTYIEPNLWARNLNLSAGILFFCFQCVWFVFRRIKPDLRRITQGAGLVFGLFCLMSLLRIIVISLAAPNPENDFFKSGLFDILIILSYQLLLILLAYSLTLMVNRRLLVDIQSQEEKFVKSFRSAPYAFMLTRSFRRADH